MAWGMIAAAVISAYSANKAGKKARRAGDAQLQFNYEVFDAEQEKYQRWLDLYGPIEENLAEFYTSITPEVFEAAGLEAEAQAYETGRQQVQTRLAQRGLGGGGLEADLLAKQEIGSAEKRASIRREAPYKAAEIKQQFFANQTGRRANLENRVQNAGTNVNVAMGNQASRLQSRADSLMQSTASIISAGAQAYARRDNSQPTVTTGEVGPRQENAPNNNQAWLEATN